MSWLAIAGGLQEHAALVGFAGPQCMARLRLAMMLNCVLYLGVVLTPSGFIIYRERLGQVYPALP